MSDRDVKNRPCMMSLEAYIRNKSRTAGDFYEVPDTIALCRNNHRDGYRDDLSDQSALDLISVASANL
jgi:hypothetical protein